MKIKKLIDRKAHEVEFLNIAQLEKKLINNISNLDILIFGLDGDGLLPAHPESSSPKLTRWRPKTTCMQSFIPLSFAIFLFASAC